MKSPATLTRSDKILIRFTFGAIIAILTFCAYIAVITPHKGMLRFGVPRKEIKK